MRHIRLLNEVSRRTPFFWFSLALICPGSLFAITTPTASPAFGHQTWQTENGLPQNSVHAILQTHDGYIWLGTEGGLARFDGIRFTVFDSQNTPNLKSSNIRALLEDREHSLWIGTADGLSRYSNSKFSVFTTEQGLPNDDVRSMYFDRAGQLWVVTVEGQAQFKNGRFAVASGGIERGAVSVIAQDRKGKQWGGGSAGLWERDGDQWRTAPLPKALAKGGVQALLADEAGSLWIGTSEGLGVLNGDAVRMFKLPDDVPSKRITALYQASPRVIWIGTERGAIRLEDGQVQRFHSPDALSNGLILSFLQDREGNLWIGTDSGGLTILRDPKFKTFESGTAGLHDLVRCVFQDHQGTIWAGTNGRGLLMSHGGEFSNLAPQSGLSSEVILSLGEDAENNLLVGTPDGLNILREGRFETLTSADGLPDDFIRSIYRDTDGSVWIGTRRGLSHWNAGKFTNFGSIQGLPSDFIGSVLRRRNGELWIGTLRGLAAFRNGRFERISLAGPALPNVITALYEDESGALWIGAEEAGLARGTPGSIFRYPASLGLPASVLGIVEDSNHQLWISSPHGLFSVSKSDLNTYAAGHAQSVSVISYGTSDGLQVNQFTGAGHPTVWRDQEQTLWFATANGLVALDKKHTSPNRVAPPVTLTSVMLDDRVSEPGQNFVIGPGLSRITFEYAGLSFVAPQKVTFKYRLLGFDQKWIEAGTRRVAYYTNLSPGKYQFEVLARNSDGIWSDSPASVMFRLEPRFYRRWWFLLLSVCTFSALIYSAYRWRVREVQSQFDAVLAERTRIAREIHDTLAQSFVAVSVQLELIHRLMPTSGQSARETLQQTRKLVQDSLAEARRSIWNLRANENEEEDLPANLSKMIKRVTANTNLEVQLNISGAYRRLPPHVEEEVLRIAGEAVANAIRHANATKLDVDLFFDTRRASLTILDDGQGFTMSSDSQGPEGHYGLRGMHERAAAIHAQLKIRSAAGEGTQVRLELPI